MSYGGGSSGSGLSSTGGANSVVAGSYANLIADLKSDDPAVQLRSAKEFYACLLNELKQMKRDEDTGFVDLLIPHIKGLANEKNTNISDKQACIYIITSIINLDQINVKVSKRHQTILFRLLNNLLVCPNHNVICMASRAIGKYVQAGVDCDAKFKPALGKLRNEDLKRYTGIILVRELALASPSRLFLNSAIFFDNIMLAICDRSANIRNATCELFRLSLVICISREPTASSSNKSASSTTSRPRRISSSLTDMAQSSPTSPPRRTQGGAATPTMASGDATNFVPSYKVCFDNSIKELSELLKDSLFPTISFNTSK